MPTYVYLDGAIISEVIGTTALKASDGMSKPGPTILLSVAYIISFYLLGITLIIAGVVILNTLSKTTLH